MSETRPAACATRTSRGPLAAAVAVAFGLLAITPATVPSAYAVAEPAQSGAATTVAPRRFAAPADAVKALIAALEKDDLKAVEAVLGGDSAALLDSGDPVADRAERRNFVAQYRKKNALVQNDDGSYTLEVGADDWPSPIPLVKGADGKWAFDAEQGRQEIVYRRIGRNELGAIGVCEGFVDAQREYAAKGRDGQPAGLYAAKLVSSPGRQDGLYWESKPGEKPSPAGPFLAQATDEGYALTGGTRVPYHGYYYRLLREQGTHAAGGAMKYEVNGQLRNGYALIAWPAEYRASGVMTFIVNQDGVVYQKDLGADTEKAALAMPAFDPDPSWQPVE